MIRPDLLEKAGSPRKPRSAFDFSIVAELSALHEISSLAFAATEEQLAQEATEKVARLFGARCFAVASGLRPRQRLLMSSGFKTPEEALARLVAAPETHSCRLTMVFNEGGEDQDILHFEQSRPIDDRARRLYGVLARRLEDRLAALRLEEERRRAEDSLRRSQARFHRALENIPAIVAIYDVDLRVQHINAAAMAVTGRPSPELFGKRGDEAWPPEVWAACQPSLRKTCETGVSQSLEAVVRVPSLGQRDLRVSCVPLIGEDGKTEEVLAITLDLTGDKERSRALEESQARLKASESRFRDVMKASSDAILLLEDRRFVDGNDAAARIYGRASWRDLVQCDPADLSPLVQPDGRGSADASEEMFRLAREQGFHRFEWIHRRANGEEFPAEVSLTAIVHEGQDRLYCVVRDITDRKRIEREMQRIRSAIEDFSDPVLLADKTGRATYVNIAFGNRFKFTGDSAPRIDLVHLFEDPAQGAEVVAGLRAGAGWEGEVRARASDGEAFPALLRAAVTMGDGYEVVGWSLAFTDLTERKRMENHLLHAQKMESVGHLAAGIAHEINTPIQFVGDNLHFLKNAFGDMLPLIARHQALADAWVPRATPEREELDRLVKAADVDYLREEIPKALAQSEEGVQRVAGIVRAMREFSHPAGEEMKAIDLNHAIATTLTITRNEWKYTAEVETRFDPALPPVIGSPGDLNQVLLNLVVNAAQAVREAHPESAGPVPGRIVVSTRRDGASAEIRVADNGPGIPPRHHAKIFTPFFTTKEVGKGTGQGLASAYNIVVNKHRGDIRFETVEGAGTTFIVRIPFEPAPTQEPAR